MIKLVNQSLREFSYYKTGGTCQVLYIPESIEDLSEVMKEIYALQMPYFLMGAGSNSLVMDDHWPGAVVSFQAMKALRVNGKEIYCEAGVDNSILAEEAFSHSLSGLAWMYRLPGQIGGTVRMNARCYGGEISQVITKVYAVSRTGERMELKTSKGDKGIFKGYKSTIFMHGGPLIAAVEIKLEKGDSDLIWKTMKLCEKDRIDKGQFHYPSCGCVFKNDYSPAVSLPSGLLLEKAGVKSLQKGGAVISPQHVNFVFNIGASSRDILELSLMMRGKVWEMFGVWLEYEVEFLGLVPEDLKNCIYEKRAPAYNHAALTIVREEFANRITK